MRPINWGGLLDALVGEWDKTKQPLKERATMLPLGQYEDGSVGLAWPGLLADPVERSYQAANTPIPAINDDQAWADKSAAMFDMTSLAPLGGMFGAVDNAVGSAGGRLFHGSPNKNLTNLKRSERGPLGPGIYTTSSDYYAKRYAGPDGKVYELPDENIDVFRGQGHRTDAEFMGWKDDVERLKAAVEPDKLDQVLPIIEKAWTGDGYPMYARLKQVYGGDEGAQALFKRAGFKGLSGQVDGPETLLFDEMLGLAAQTQDGTDPQTITTANILKFLRGQQ